MKNETTKKEKRAMLELRVRYVRNSIPEFEFIGDWRGRDIVIVRNLLRRNYIRWQRENSRMERQQKEVDNGRPE